MPYSPHISLHGTCRWRTASCSSLYHWQSPTCSAPSTELHKHGTLPSPSFNLHSSRGHPPTTIPGLHHVFNSYGIIPAVQHATARHCWQHAGWAPSHPPRQHTGCAPSHPPRQHTGWAPSHPPRQHTGWAPSHPPRQHTGWAPSCWYYPTINWTASGKTTRTTDWYVFYHKTVYIAVLCMYRTAENIGSL